MKATVIHFEVTKIITHVQDKRLVKSKRGDYHRRMRVKLKEPVMVYNLVILLENKELNVGTWYYDGFTNYLATTEQTLVNVYDEAKTIKLPQTLFQIAATHSEGSAEISQKISQTINLQYNP